jgi:hypothetical protein
LTRISEQEPAGVGIDAIFAEQEHPLSGKKLSPSARKQTPGDLALAGGPFVSVSGYRGQQRLMALADAYDAVVSRRIYPHETVIRIIIEESGIQFDPVVVDAFLKAEKQWRQIASDLVDSDEVEVMAK